MSEWTLPAKSRMGDPDQEGDRDIDTIGRPAVTNQK
jgi:hypothetical protein